MTDQEFTLEVEKSIRKRFRRQIWSRFTKAINTYELIREGDRIAVCISGGKDSMLMAKLFQELKRHNKFQFELVFLVMDPGYSAANRRAIEDNARRLSVPVTIFESDIFASVFHVEKSPCYLCARMRRGYLYSHAQALGCNKIALGHHYDDVIETILMGMLYGAQVQTMMPKLHSTNFPGMELIRPLYLIREDDIKAWRDANGLQFLRCACKFTEQCAAERSDAESSSKRLEVKRLIAQMKRTNPFVEGNIFKSVENVMLDTVIGYKKDGVRHRFLDDYDDRASGADRQGKERGKAMDIEKRFEFREVRSDEADEVARIEEICFPPNEACSGEQMRARVKIAPETFLVAVDRENGKIAGLLNGLATDETDFRDAFFEDASLHRPDGETIMLLGLDVLPDYRKQGLATALVDRYRRKEWAKGRRRLVLTCLPRLVAMYERMGFSDLGISASVWGGETWHDMESVRED